MTTLTREKIKGSVIIAQYMGVEIPFRICPHGIYIKQFEIDFIGNWGYCNDNAALAPVIEKVKSLLECMDYKFSMRNAAYWEYLKICDNLDNKNDFNSVVDAIEFVMFWQK